MGLHFDSHFIFTAYVLSLVHSSTGRWPGKHSIDSVYTKVTCACVDTMKDGRFLKFQDASLTEEVKLRLDMVRESAKIYNKYKGPKKSGKGELSWPVKGIMLRKAK